MKNEVTVSRQAVMKDVTIKVNVTGFKGWWWRTAFAMKCFELGAKLLGCNIEVRNA